MPLRISALCALLLSAAVQAATAGGIDLQANREPIRAEPNPAAIALIPANFHFAVPGKLTVAVAFENSPPLALFADDNKTLIGSDPDIARLVADSLGLALNLVPTSSGRLAAGHQRRQIRCGDLQHRRHQTAQDQIRLRHLSGGHAGLLRQIHQPHHLDQPAAGRRRAADHRRIRHQSGKHSAGMG